MKKVLKNISLVAVSLALIGIAGPNVSASEETASKPPVNFISHRQQQDEQFKETLTNDFGSNYFGQSESNYKTSSLPLINTTYGFHPYWSGSSYNNYRWSALSRIAYFKIEVTFDGYLNTSNPNYNPPAALISTAHTNGTKVDLAVTGTDLNAEDALLSSATYYNRAADNIVAKVIAAGADGVNIDFELNDVSTRAAFTSFVAAVRDKMHAAKSGSWVTVDMPAIDWGNAYDFSGLAAAADRLIIMGYDYSGSWSSTAGPVAPLYDTSWRSNYSVRSSLDDYLAVVGAHRIILAVPWYGGSFATSNSNVPTNSNGWLGSMTYDQAQAEAANNVSNWYSPSLVPYTTNSGSTFQTWFDNYSSLNAKYGEADAEGLAGVAVWALGYDGNRAELWDGLESYGTGTANSLKRLAGNNRYGTSANISRELYSATDSANAAVVTTGKNWPDALGGSTLATVVKGPLLLTDPSNLSSETATELKRVLLSGKKVYLLGGQSAVSATVEDQINNLGLRAVRISGSDRVATAIAIANAMALEPTTIMLGTSANFPDALSLASPAARGKHPILLTDPNTLSQAVLDYLNGPLGKNIANIYIAGGDAAISESIATQLRGLGYVVPRLAGKDRYETSARIAAHFYPSPNQITMATGENYADGLSGGPLAAAHKAPVLLTKRIELPGQVSNWLKNRATFIEDGYIFGGTSAINTTVQNIVQQLIAP